MMTPKARELAAIRHQATDRIAIDAICVENVGRLAAHLGLEAGAVLDHLGIDGRIVSAPYRGALREPEGGVAFNEWGTPNTGDYGTARSYPLAGGLTVAAAESLPLPALSDYDFAWTARTAAALGGRYALRGPYWQPLFCRACDLCGMEAAMALMLDDPAAFEALLERLMAHLVPFCERMLAAGGDHLPIFCLGDDFATQRGLVISPTAWRRFLRPRYARLFALAHARGKFVWFHSCGDVTAVLPDLIDLGVNVWETVQLHTLPLSPERLKQEYGRHLTFFGGINTQRLPFRQPAEVRAEVQRVIGMLGRGGGYICGPDHHIKPDVSVENTLALFETAQQCPLPPAA